MLKNKILSSVSGQDKKLYVDDVFTSYVRTGTGADVTINTGIDMTEGYMLWSKSRSASTDHAVYDSARGVTLDLVTNSTAAQTTQSTGLKAVSSTGYTVGSLAKINASGATYVDWVWKKAPKFFDIVTYTGNGASSRAIAHSLGQEVGMVITKATSTTGGWNTYHRSATGDLVLNTTAAQTGSKALVNSATTSTFTVSGAANTNAVTYVAYLFAHDPSADGFIQCGSFTTDASGNASVTLGWETQYLVVKRSDSATSGAWQMYDTMRGMDLSNSTQLQAQSSGADSGPFGSAVWPTATGFAGDSTALIASANYIYLAIRRPNKPPTTGTEVYNAIARTGNDFNNVKIETSILPDAAFIKRRADGDTTVGWIIADRLRGGNASLSSNRTANEESSSGRLSIFGQSSITVGAEGSVNGSGIPYINLCFRRAPGFMDVVCDTGTGAAHAIPHNLTKAPELIIRKSRSAATQWEVWHSALAATEKLVLNSTAAKATDATAWNSTAPTATQFTVGTGANVNANAATFVTYLFATLAGISKVGSYTGNGTTQTINCGFTTGSRFILIKRTDSASDWYVWDSVRGIISANDPHLSLNTTASEVTTDDSVDPEVSGFIVNHVAATNINVNAASYIFVAIA